jgi:hypothetical protein
MKEARPGGSAHLAATENLVEYEARVQRLLCLAILIEGGPFLVRIAIDLDRRLLRDIWALFTINA